MVTAVIERIFLILNSISKIKCIPSSSLFLHQKVHDMLPCILKTFHLKHMSEWNFYFIP